ncbi:DNA cytosine methyltransferase [Mesorhizobium sp. M0187]|uniref:DNA cytosine methyltransferase n=1 Tax=unclassified Mesorhizobium TaxID=325217 RepID=UPI00333B5B66
MNTVVDLFCGCGGLSLGAANAGLFPAVSIDVDRTLSSAYALNFPHSKILNEDLLTLDPASLAHFLGSDRLTAILGGPPCQGFSVMGRRKVNDPRNALLLSYFRNVAALRPRFFFMENVPGLMEETNRGALDRALDILPSSYKVLDPLILDAADYGAATSRPRLVVIGYDPSEMDHLTKADLVAAKVGLRPTVRDAIGDLPGPTVKDEWVPYPAKIVPTEYGTRMRRPPPEQLGSKLAIEKLAQGLISGFQPTVHTVAVEERFAKLEAGRRDKISKYPKLSWERSAYVLRAGTGSEKGSFQAARPVHPEEPRVITVREAARIQGFPDWFQFHPTKWHSHRMIGNSVAPPFAEAVLKVIVSKMGLDKFVRAA